MTETPPDPADEAHRWLGEAHEELAVAQVLADDDRLPARAACFHAHLAAEKALQALLILREVKLKFSHDLALLVGMLAADDAALFDIGDLAALNPWTIEGRYPADLADSASSDHGHAALGRHQRRVKFLVDAPLPARLARLLNEHGHDATHKSELPNGNRTPDDEIAAVADAEDRVVISKDRDFRYSHFLKGTPRKLLVVRTGNISNDDLLALFEVNLEQITDALEEAPLVMLGPKSLSVHPSKSP